jgi:hypothetical protein
MLDPASPCSGCVLDAIHATTAKMPPGFRRRWWFRWEVREQLEVRSVVAIISCSARLSAPPVKCSRLA